MVRRPGRGQALATGACGKLSQMPIPPVTVFDRAVALESLESGDFDVLVVGGGITGAGVLLDAASRGLTTCLIERDDFASGTSSKSSKLVHGGLRYLKQHELGLVHENLVERQRLLRNAPHLVEPLPFLVPLLGSGKVLDRAVAHSYSVALWLYDLSGGWRIGKRHRRVSADEIARKLPTLRRDRLVAGFVYFDARADDARLTLEVMRTAVLSHGGVAANHATVTGISTARGGGLTEVLVDPGDKPPFAVRARCVVNATGVFADEVRALAEGAHPRSLRPAKGVHVAVERAKLPCEMAAILPVPNDRRTIFVIPWGDHTYIGTTDTDYDGPMDSPTVEPEDVDYLLRAVNAAVSEPLTAADVTGSWAGLRPLLAPNPSGRRPPGERTADLSRRHQVTVSREGLVTVTGGKLTTYRKMAEDAVDAAVRVAGVDARPCRTRRLKLRGAAGSDLSSTAKGFEPWLLAHLEARYGSEAGAVLRLVRERPELAEPLVAGLPYIAAEAVFAVRYEMARELEDVLARRTRALLLDARATREGAPRVAELVGDELGWDTGKRRHAADAFDALATS